MKKLLITFFCLILIGCTSLEKASLLTPQPANSDYFKTLGGGFTGIFQDGKLTDIHYSVSLELIKPISNDLLLDVCYENPQDRIHPICENKEFLRSQKQITLRSPVAVSGLTHLQNYEVVIAIWDAEKINLLGKHAQMIRYHEIKTQNVPK